MGNKRKLQIVKNLEHIFSFILKAPIKMKKTESILLSKY